MASDIAKTPTHDLSWRPRPELNWEFFSKPFPERPGKLGLNGTNVRCVVWDISEHMD